MPGSGDHDKHAMLGEAHCAFGISPRICSAVIAGCPFCEMRARLAVLSVDHDPDYSKEYQDEYQRLWHKAAAERDALSARLAALEEIVEIVRARRQRFADKWHPPNHPRNEEERRLDELLGIEERSP